MGFYYIAGPLSGKTSVKRKQNVMRAVEAAALLRKNGIACVVPHSESLFNEDCVTEDTWLAMDFEIIIASDGIIVLPGYENSKGTLKEIQWAQKLLVPVLSFNKILDRLNIGHALPDILDNPENIGL